jgi:hypothetical protein
VIDQLAIKYFGKPETREGLHYIIHSKFLYWKDGKQTVMDRDDIEWIKSNCKKWDDAYYTLELK